jgi:single-strand DNA-binding protein
MYQQITLIGRLGQDPEMRYTPSGVPVTNFSLAVSRSWTGEDGQRQEKTVWFRVAAWQRLAETSNQYLAKGQRALVVGEMEEPSIWTDQNGKTQASLQIRARTALSLATRAEAEALAVGMDQHGGQPASNGGGPGPEAETSDEEDIPF